MNPSDELRRATAKADEGLWFPADLAHLRQPIVQLLQDGVVPWERIEWQNSRPGEARTRVCPNELESAACLDCENEWGMHHRCPAQGGRYVCC